MKTTFGNHLSLAEFSQVEGSNLLGFLDLLLVATDLALQLINQSLREVKKVMQCRYYHNFSLLQSWGRKEPHYLDGARVVTRCGYGSRGDVQRRLLINVTKCNTFILFLFISTVNTSTFNHRKSQK
jgi:hypothetical protein